ncbi:MAG: hypothetical protein J7474_12095, partial [Arthrobacter sp.]|nr:hypothetical protein [Arthrobacter sp.]
MSAPPYGHDDPSGHQVPGRQPPAAPEPFFVPEDQQLNPSWIGRVDPESYTQPGANYAGRPPLQPSAPLQYQDQQHQGQQYQGQQSFQQPAQRQAFQQPFQQPAPGPQAWQQNPSPQGQGQQFPQQAYPAQQAPAWPAGPQQFHGAWQQTPTGWAPPRRHRNINPATLALMIIGGVLAFLSLVLVLPLLLSNVGGQGFMGGFFASLIPLAIVLTAVYFMDRWEPEPRKLLLFALLWGATVAVATTVVIQPFFLQLAPPDSTKAEVQT